MPGEVELKKLREVLVAMKRDMNCQQQGFINNF